MVFNATFNNISVISWRKHGVPRENHWPASSHWQTLSDNIVSSTRLNHVIGVGYQVNDNIVILGDLNSDLFTANNNKLIETMMLFNLVNIISKPTGITAHSNTLLDPIIISDTMHYIYSEVWRLKIWFNPPFL